MTRILIPLMLLALTACSAEPGSQKWCEAKSKQPKSEWTASDATTYASHCIFDNTEVGSESWCKNLKEKPKGEWTANEATTYTKHCVL